MLAFYQRWAVRLYPWRPVFILMFLSATSSFVWLLFAAPQELAQRWQLTAVLLAICGLFLWLCSTLFRHPLAEPHSSQHLFQRVKLRVVRAGYYVVAIIVTLLLIAITYLGLRIVKGIIADLFFQ
jgi:hypothetical protein